MADEAAQAVARGRLITLVDGRQVRVVFTLYSLAVIEDDFGSIDAIDQVLREGTKGKLIRTLGKLLSTSIQGETFTEDEILKQIALEDVGEVFVQVQEAMREGFQKGPRTPSGPTSQSSSPGPDSNTSGVSSSDNASATSGA